MAAPLPGADVSLVRMDSPAMACTEIAASLPSLAFCSRLAGASMRAYAGSPWRSTRSE